VQLWSSAVSGFGVKGREGGAKVADFDMDKDLASLKKYVLHFINRNVNYTSNIRDKFDYVIPHICSAFNVSTGSMD
jgi:hypothetical protein